MNGRERRQCCADRRSTRPVNGVALSSSKTSEPNVVNCERPAGMTLVTLHVTRPVDRSVAYGVQAKRTLTSVSNFPVQVRVAVGRAEIPWSACIDVSSVSIAVASV